MRVHAFRRSSRRAAMTLLELLLALALCGLLMTATGTSLHLMMQLRSRSQAQIADTQTIRALLDQVARDLRSVRRVAVTQRGSQVPEPRLEQNLDLRKSLLNLQASSVVPVELIGADSWLSVHSERQEHSNSAGSAVTSRDASQNAASHLADGLHVIWWNGGSRAIPYASDGFRLLEARVQGPRQLSGPSRISFPVTPHRDRTTLFADPLTAGAQLRFRYFDGVEWRDSWDSTECGCLPQAVECRVTLGRDQSESMVIALAANASLRLSQGLSQR